MKLSFASIASIVALLGITSPSGCVSGSSEIAKSAVAIKDAAALVAKESGETRSLVAKSEAGLVRTIEKTKAAQSDLDLALQTEGEAHSNHIGSARLNLDEAIGEATTVSLNLSAISPHLDTVEKETSRVSQSAAKTLLTLPKVQDIESQFSKNLRSIMWIVGAIAAIYVLWYAGPVLRRGLFLIGRGIPAGTATAAKMDVESLADDDLSSNQRERIAVQRATNPAYEAAFKKQKKLNSAPKKKKKRKS